MTTPTPRTPGSTLERAKPDIRYLSFGAGVQSTALLIACAEGMDGFPRPDVAIFADTGDEPAWVYENVERMTAWAAERGMVVETVSAGCLSEDTKGRQRDTQSRCAAIPVFTQGADGRSAITRRQCTREYKIEPIERRVRQLLGAEKGERLPKGTRAEALIGISTDEFQRAAKSRSWWVRNRYPLIEQRMNRGDCKKLIERAGLPVPLKSSCVFCPYHSDGFWLRLKRHHPAEWQRAVEFDAAVRDMSRNGMRWPVYLHRSLRPLADVDLQERQGELFEDCVQPCGGHCGV